MASLQKYGIKFPITILSTDRSLVDMNPSKNEEIRSELIHLIFTPKGQRLRNPDFGTRLIQYIFNPNDNETWSDIMMEIKETVEKYIPSCSIKDIEVKESDNGIGLILDMTYTVKRNNAVIEYTTSLHI